MIQNRLYTTQLQAGLGLIQETQTLLNLWEPGVDTTTLSRMVLESGQFPNVSARRLRNVVMECFAPRYLCENAQPASLLKELGNVLSPADIQQLLFRYTCRANAILRDFVTQVYWPHYATGHDTLHLDQAREFVIRANQSGKTTRLWSESTVKRVSSYLLGCCTDFGLLEKGRGNLRKMVPYHCRPTVACVIAYDLHFAGVGDNGIMAHPDWELFALERHEVLDLLKRLALRGLLILQAASNVVRISWNCQNMEELRYALNEG
tara:strand:- start:2268 stop:3056 length:789 start_codon:yes stop_codon:yes gene_type:complete